MGEPTRVLVVDDDAAIRMLFSAVLKDSGFVVATASCANEAMARLGTFAPHVVLTDYDMPGPSGLELVAQLAHAATPVTAYVMSGRGELREQALRSGAAGFFEKPFEVRAFIRALHDAAGAKSRGE